MQQGWTRLHLQRHAPVVPPPPLLPPMLAAPPRLLLLLLLLLVLCARPASPCCAPEHRGPTPRAPRRQCLRCQPQPARVAHP